MNKTSPVSKPALQHFTYNHPSQGLGKSAVSDLEGLPKYHISTVLSLGIRDFHHSAKDAAW